MAGKTRNRKKIRSIDRSVERHALRRSSSPSLATNTPRRICIHAEIRGLRARIFDFDRGYRLKFLLPRIFANIFLSSEEDVSTNFFERNGGGIFSRGYQVRVARILRNIVCSPGENNLDIGCYNIDLLARRT